MNSKTKTILASASPRRRELLNLIDIFPKVNIPDVKEYVHEGETPVNFVSRIAAEKGNCFRNRENSDKLIISADTIVLSDRKIIGKPSSRGDAAEMLNILSGRTHKVITGVSLMYLNKKIVNNSETDVKFSDISRKEIDHYLDNEQYMDKAGAYAIQGRASLFIEKINGCYFNVMGFPLNLFYSMIRVLNIPIEKIEGRNINEENDGLQ